MKLSPSLFSLVLKRLLEQSKPIETLNKFLYSAGVPQPGHLSVFASQHPKRFQYW